MATNISSNGILATLIASNSFPFVPLIISHWSHEFDSIDFENETINKGVLDLNGRAIVYSVAIPIICKLSVIYSSISDIKLALLHSLNRIGGGKNSARDRILMTITGNNMIPIVCTGGWIESGDPVLTSTSSGYLKSKSYKFGFESVVGIPVSL